MLWIGSYGWCRFVSACRCAVAVLHFKKVACYQSEAVFTGKRRRRGINGSVEAITIVSRHKCVMVAAGDCAGRSFHADVLSCWVSTELFA